MGLLMVGCAVTASAQIRSVSGELAYQHQYQDILSGDMLATMLRQSPRFSLNVAGDLIDPQLINFSLRTALSLDFGSGRSGTYSLSTRQSLWDSYDMSLAVFQYSPVKVNLSARDNILTTRSESGFSETFSTSVRRQEQRFSASTYKIKALPSTTVGFERTRTFSTYGDPFDQVAQRFSLGMSTSNGGSAMSVSGGVSRLQERVSGLRNTFTNMQLSATKDFTEENRLDVTADYDRYDDYGTLGGNASFNAVLSEAVRTFTSIFGRNSSSKVSSSLFYGGSQGVQITHDDHWQSGGTISARAGNDIRTVGLYKVGQRYLDWATGASLQHSREIGLGSIQNSVNASYLEQHLQGERRSLSGGFSSGFSSSIGVFTLGLGYGLSGGVTMNGSKRYSVGNTANLTLNGTLPNRLHSQTSANYNDERYSGDVKFLRNRRTLMARQGISMPVTFLIPFFVGGGANVTWYFSDMTGKAYGWYFSFNSGSFFLRGLTAAYRYNRTYDPYYLREYVEQTAELRYQWRSVLFELRLREYRIIGRRREVWFSMARPFAL